MIDALFLAYLSDPFGARDAAFWCLTSDGRDRRTNAREISGSPDITITYDLPGLTDTLRKLGHEPPKRVIDLGNALRLGTGVPVDEGRERRANIWRRLAVHFPNIAKAQQFEAAAKSQKAWPCEPVFSELLKVAAHAVQLLWCETSACLSRCDELERFLNVESPVEAIFAYRQSAGIAIHAEACETLLERLEEEKYAAFRRVAITLGVSPTGLNFWNIGERLKHTDAAHLSHTRNGGRLRDDFKIASLHSQFARDFLQYTDALRDEVIVRRTMGPEGRVYPTFDVIGTVSGRIMVYDPHLQHLRRRYRSIVAADPGKRLIYLDYSQFEPGVLAYLSGDPNMISAYNGGDLYTALCQRVFGTSDQRPLSKQMFLAFCYGMTPERISELATKAGDADGALTCKQAVNDFFMAFPGLVKYRCRLADELQHQGYVSSLLGNRRNRTQSGPLTHKERRWAVNQPIQATQGCSMLSTEDPFA